MTRARKERLGRGLGALLGEFLEEENGQAPTEMNKIPLERIQPNPFQPRKEFPPEELEELARSIKDNGLLQPLVVRPAPGQNQAWQLVAGERRLRAVTQLGWTEVPAWVREVDDQTLLVLALVENLQREALSPLEEAEGYRILADSFDLTQGEIAQAVGKDRSTVANTLRLLHLPPSVRKLVEAGELSSGHARALLAVDDPVRAGELARKAVRDGWSVRRMEDAVRATRNRATATEKARSRRGDGAQDPALRALQEELRVVLSSRVVLRRSGRGAGTIEIPFLGAEDFERIFLLLTGREATEILE